MDLDKTNKQQYGCHARILTLILFSEMYPTTSLLRNDNTYINIHVKDSLQTTHINLVVVLHLVRVSIQLWNEIMIRCSLLRFPLIFMESRSWDNLRMPSLLNSGLLLGLCQCFLYSSKFLFSYSSSISVFVSMVYMARTGLFNSLLSLALENASELQPIALLFPQRSRKLWCVSVDFT